MKAIWRPTAESLAESSMVQFAKFASERLHRNLSEWRDLYAWSIDDVGSFWQLCSEYVRIQWIQEPHQSWIAPPHGAMRGARWFPGGTLNFCQNVLPFPDERTVLISQMEDDEAHFVSGRQLHNEVAKLIDFLRSHKIGSKDVVCGVLCNSYEAIAAMLATTAIGAIWSSCSPDFGITAICERLGQIHPKLGFFSLNYSYNQRFVDCRANIEELMRRLPSLQIAVVVEHKDFGKSLLSSPMHLYSSIVGSAAENQKSPARPLRFVETPFDHPAFILFSSGTTGAPKCIVHGAGGTLLQHKKEHILHCNLGAKDRLFFYTTCGWMMWNWMASALASGSSVVCYDGSPRIPKELGLWQTVDTLDVSVFGTSPKFLSIAIKEDWVPKQNFEFASLRSILTTGSPLLAEHFQWVHSAVKKVPIASISGGTDIVSCFMLGNPMLPIYEGTIQSAGLGMAIHAFDENAKAVIGEKGELVCTKPFVSMPLYFLDDPDGKRYQQSYFAYYQDELWRHGDFISIDENGSIIVYGRSDATLNPGGVRIGTAELYRCVEKHPQILDSIAIGYEFEAGDPAILLFVKIQEAMHWDANLERSLQVTIRKELSPRHVPQRIFQVQDIPYTRNGKKVELAVSQSVRGERIPNQGAIANPECLEEYVDIGKSLRASQG